jgi:hypothetical protein
VIVSYILAFTARRHSWPLPWGRKLYPAKPGPHPEPVCKICQGRGRILRTGQSHGMVHGTRLFAVCGLYFTNRKRPFLGGMRRAYERNNRFH